MGPGPSEHPIIRNFLLYGSPVPPARIRCESCGAAAEVWSDAAGCLCRTCALDRWTLLDEEQRLALLGYAPLS